MRSHASLDLHRLRILLFILVVLALLWPSPASGLLL
jgi:hypothetical protein